MLEHLRQRVIKVLASVQAVTLTSSGAAGLQASHLPCEAVETELFVLVPRASDHLFNIETQPEVMIIDDTWNLRGQARLVPTPDLPPELRQHPQAKWSTALVIHPTRLNVLSLETGNPIETIDLD